LKKEVQKYETLKPSTGEDIRTGGITYFWNKIFYNMWRFSCWRPLSKWFLSRKAVQRAYKKRGVEDVEKEVNALEPLMYGHAFYGLLMLTGFLFLPIAMYVMGIFLERELIPNSSLLIAIIVFMSAGPSYLINYYLLGWMKDGYIPYFEKFEKESKKEKRKWKWITIFTILIMLGAIIGQLIIVLRLS